MMGYVVDHEIPLQGRIGSENSKNRGENPYRSLIPMGMSFNKS